MLDGSKVGRPDLALSGFCRYMHDCAVFYAIMWKNVVVLGGKGIGMIYTVNQMRNEGYYGNPCTAP